MLLGVAEDRRDGNVFCPQHRDQPVHPKRVAEQFRAITWKAGVPHVHLHDYRRAFGTRMVMEDQVTVFELMKLMRHRDIKTTLKYYLHLDTQSITGNIRRRKAEERGESGNRSGNTATETGALLPVS